MHLDIYILCVIDAAIFIGKKRDWAIPPWPHTYAGACLPKKKKRSYY
jgi:hypothetical protein